MLIVGVLTCVVSVAGVRERGKGKSWEEGMARNAVDKATSIDAQLRLLAPQKLSDDDKLVEYDALLLDRFLDILQDLHGEDIRETVHRCSD
jgi:phosphoenolpyruvate carboxylase